MNDYRRRPRRSGSAWKDQGGGRPRYPHMLSGGMKRRLAIARAMAMAPAIPLMDEPYEALVFGGSSRSAGLGWFIFERRHDLRTAYVFAGLTAMQR